MKNPFNTQELTFHDLDDTKVTVKKFYYVWNFCYFVKKKVTAVEKKEQSPMYFPLENDEQSEWLGIL